MGPVAKGRMVKKMEMEKPKQKEKKNRRRTGQGQGVGRSAKVHNPGVVDLETAAGDARIVAVVVRAEQVARSKMFDQELHDARRRLDHHHHDNNNRSRDQSNPGVPKTSGQRDLGREGQCYGNKE